MLSITERRTEISQAVLGGQIKSKKKKFYPTNPKGNQPLDIHWTDWCWSRSSNTLATWCKELTHWERPWCWERLKAGGEGDDRGWDGGMISLIQQTLSLSKLQERVESEGPGSLVCCSPWGCRVGHNLATEKPPPSPYLWDLCGMFAKYAAHHRVTKWSLLLKTNKQKNPQDFRSVSRGLES